MVMCKRCGRALTWPKSVRRGLGPVCYKKMKGKESAVIFGYMAPEDLELERQMLIFLHKQKNVTVSSTSLKNHRRRERDWKKKGYLWISDYSYHSYSRLKERLLNSQHEHVAVCYDEYSRTVDNKRYSAMTIALMEKIPKKVIQRSPF